MSSPDVSYDDNFLNYAELYTKPSDLKVNTLDSIGQYANALITGKNAEYAYSDTPDLVGNRYFINTGTQCIDYENKTHTRSVLVDNVLTSTMKKTADSNTGLMYSLLASMQTLNSDIMFTDMSNNEPSSNAKYSPTGYLSDIANKANLPTCSKVTVYSNSKEDSDTSGWVTTDDRADMDPEGIKEGFDFSMPDVIEEGTTVGAMQANLNQSVREVSATRDALGEETKKTMDKGKAEHDKMIEDSKKTAAEFAKNAAASATSTGNSAKSSSAARAKAEKSKAAQSGIKILVAGYLKDNPELSTLDIMNLLINLKYTCGERNIYRRVPSEAILSILKGESDKPIKSVDVERSDLVEGQDLPKEYTINTLFESIAALVEKNETNFEKSLDVYNDLPAGLFPKKTIQIIVKYPVYWPSYGFMKLKVFKEFKYRNDTIDSVDYASYMNLLNEGRYDDYDTIKFATALVYKQYEQPGAFGTEPIQSEVGIYAPGSAPVDPDLVDPASSQSAATIRDIRIANEAIKKANDAAALKQLQELQESFSTLTNDNDYWNTPITWFYLLSMCLIILYIIYKFVDRSFRFELSLL